MTGFYTLLKKEILRFWKVSFQTVAAPVLTLALQMRFASQDDTGYANRLLAMMRNAFGGHAIKRDGN